MSMDEALVSADTEPEPPVAPQRTLALRLYELAVSLPIVAFIAVSMQNTPDAFKDPQILIWIAAIAAVDLMPVPTTMSSVAFSLSFPIELSVALLYPPPVAALIALLGSSDQREFRGQLPFLKALFIRAQIAGAVICESLVFKRAVPSWAAIANGTADFPYVRVAIGVILASIVGYAVNLTFVAIYNYLANGENPWRFVRQIHVGVFGEFLVAYMALALFSVLVVSGFRTFRAACAILIFLAPLLFARQMFQRTHSLQKATDELAVKQAENEYQALHDSLTGMPNRMFFHQRLLAEIEQAREQRQPHGRDPDRPRPLQGDQRHPRPPLRRQAAAGGGAAAVERAARQRPDGTARRRRVRHHPAGPPERGDRAADRRPA